MFLAVPQYLSVTWAENSRLIDVRDASPACNTLQAVVKLPSACLYDALSTVSSADCVLLTVSTFGL